MVKLLSNYVLRTSVIDQSEIIRSCSIIQIRDTGKAKYEQQSIRIRSFRITHRNQCQQSKQNHENLFIFIFQTINKVPKATSRSSSEGGKRQKRPFYLNKDGVMCFSRAFRSRLLTHDSQQCFPFRCDFARFRILSLVNLP